MGRNFIFFALFNFIALSELSANYSYEDLNVLSQEKNYSEYLKHAHDIAPVQRDESWKKMTRDQIKGYLSQLVDQKNWEEKSFQRVLEMSSWPLFKTSPSVLASFSPYALGRLKFCFSTKKSNQASQCLSEVDRVWAILAHKDDMASEAFEMTLLLHQEKSKRNLWDFASLTTRSPHSAQYCQNSLIQNLLLQQMQGLYLKTTQPLGSSWKNALLEMANTQCWTQLQSKLIQSLSSPSHAHNEVHFLGLLALGMIDQTQQDLFYLQYLLTTPKASTTFNLAWNRIESLGENWSQRKKIMKELLKRPHLPDHIFHQGVTKKVKTISQLINTHFPEYFQAYKKKCDQYYNGLKKFPLGNPTLYCQKVKELKL